MRREIVVLLALVMGFLPAVGALLPAAAQTATVEVSGDECNYNGLVEAIAAVDDGGTVTFNCTDTTIDFTAITGNITIDKTVTIDGSNGDSPPMIFDGNQATNMFVVPAGGHLTVQQLTFTNGNAPPGSNAYVEGGAIDGDGGDITVHGSTFTSNTADYGGAIDNDFGTLEITQSSFTNNSASTAGAIWNRGTAEISQGSTFTSNTAIFGGAIDNDGTLEISQSSFTGNQTDSDAGAIWNRGTAEIRQSSFTNNSTARVGGAIVNSSSLTVESSTFSGNTGYFGSAIHISPSATATTLRWSTIVQPAEATPALSLWSSVTLEGVILAGDGNNCTFSGGSMFDSYTIADDASCQLDGAGSHVTEPGLGPVATQTIAGVEQTYYPLMETSPAVEGGGTDCDVANQEDVDQLGTARPQGTFCDIGAVESSFTNGYPQFGAYGPLGPPSSFTVGNPIDFLADVWDPDGDPLVTAVDCESTGEFTTSMTCTYEAAGTYTVTLRATDTDDAATTVQLPIQIIEPVNLCANRWTGDLRMPDADRCARTETLLSLPADGPLTLCANRWNGEARYSEYGRCSSTEVLYETTDDVDIPVCVNRWDGNLRISDRCYNTERKDQL